jgi:O-antigen/teichoic acid export membrane protein
LLNGVRDETAQVGAGVAGGRARLAAFVRHQALVSLTSYGASLVAVSVLLPVLVRVLGAKQYGAWVLTGGLVNYVTLVDFGMSLTVSRFVALAYTNRRSEAEEAIGVGLVVVGVIGTVIAATVIPLAGWWERYLGVAGAAFALRIAALALAALLISKVLQSAVEGAGKVAVSRVVQAIGTISFAAVGAAIVFLTSRKLEALSLVLLANTVGLALAYAVLLAKIWGWRVPARKPKRGAWPRVVGYAVTTQTGSVVALSVDPISRLLLVTAAGPAAVAPLDVALRTSTQWFGAGLAFTRPALPSLGHLSHDDDLAARRADELWRRLFAAAVPTAVYAAAVVYFVFPTIFGSVGHRAGALAAVSILLVTTSLVATIPYVYVVLYGRARNLLSIQLVTSAVGLGLTLSMIWWIGAWAPVLGLGFGSLLGALVTIRIARRRAGRSAAPFGLSTLRAGIGVRNVAAPLAILLLFLAPGPLVARALAASAAWFLLTFPEIRSLLRVI